MPLSNLQLLSFIDVNYPPLLIAVPTLLVTVGIQGVTSAAVHCHGGTSRTSTVSKPVVCFQVWRYSFIISCMGYLCLTGLANFLSAVQSMAVIKCNVNSVNLMMHNIVSIHGYVTR